MSDIVQSIQSALSNAIANEEPITLAGAIVLRQNNDLALITQEGDVHLISVQVARFQVMEE